ncbi:MAG: Flp family type IVb pilin [Bradymonadaceae bacterium]|nr:Flp family type IVb pilin [Lujinxingiaceae bacterium]
MQALTNLLIAFHSDEDGATATEYIILLILIACFVIALVKIFGETIGEKFTSANDKVVSDVTF